MWRFNEYCDILNYLVNSWLLSLCMWKSMKRGNLWRVMAIWIIYLTQNYFVSWQKSCIPMKAEVPEAAQSASRAIRFFLIFISNFLATILFTLSDFIINNHFSGVFWLYQQLFCHSALHISRVNNRLYIPYFVIKIWQENIYVFVNKQNGCKIWTTEWRTGGIWLHFFQVKNDIRIRREIFAENKKRLPKLFCSYKMVFKRGIFIPIREPSRVYANLTFSSFFSICIWSPGWTASFLFALSKYLCLGSCWFRPCE